MSNLCENRLKETDRPSHVERAIQKTLTGHADCWLKQPTNRSTIISYVRYSKCNRVSKLGDCHTAAEEAALESLGKFGRECPRKFEALHYKVCSEKGQSRSADDKSWGGAREIQAKLADRRSHEHTYLNTHIHIMAQWTLHPKYGVWWQAVPNGAAQQGPLGLSMQLCGEAGSPRALDELHVWWAGW